MRTTKLTDRQVQIVELLAEGLTDGAIARRLGIKVSTVKVTSSLIADKLGIQRGAPGNNTRRGKIVMRAYEEGYLK